MFTHAARTLRNTRSSSSRLVTAVATSRGNWLVAGVRAASNGGSSAGGGGGRGRGGGGGGGRGGGGGGRGGGGGGRGGGGGGRGRGRDVRIVPEEWTIDDDGVRVFGPPNAGPLSREQQEFVSKNVSLRRLGVQDRSHLAWPNIERDAAALTASSCEPWTTPTQEQVLRFETREYLSATADPISGAEKVTLRVQVTDLGLEPEAIEKLCILAGPRYKSKHGELKLVGKRYPTKELNKQYLKQLLATLITESKKADDFAD